MAKRKDQSADGNQFYRKVAGKDGHQGEGGGLNPAKFLPTVISMKRLPLISVFAVSILLLAGCVTNPETGRSQLMLVSQSEEAQMGLSSFTQIKQQEKISTDPVANARVQRVGKRIAASVGREIPNAQWEFVVFDSAQVNAFALPGGKVGVYTGLLKLATTDDELAIVMGHEIAHVTSRHGAERTSQNYAIAGVGALAAFGMEAKQVDPAQQKLILAAYGIGSQVGFALPYSRLQESEADSVGLKFAAGAGYDPRAAVIFWRKMAAQGGQKPPALLSTHPSDAQRIQNLQQLAPRYMVLYEQSKLKYGGN